MPLDGAIWDALNATSAIWNSGEAFVVVAGSVGSAMVFVCAEGYYGPFSMREIKTELKDIRQILDDLDDDDIELIRRYQENNSAVPLEELKSRLKSCCAEYNTLDMDIREATFLKRLRRKNGDVNDLYDRVKVLRSDTVSSTSKALAMHRNSTSGESNDAATETENNRRSSQDSEMTLSVLPAPVTARVRVLRTSALQRFISLNMPSLS